MNPAYDNSVPFYPTIPNQNPINTFFPNQMQHARDAVAPQFQNAGFPNPPPQSVSYPAGFGYNSNRSIFFPPPNPSLGINPGSAPMYPSNRQNLVNPEYYPNSSLVITCSCGNPSHNSVLANSNHAPTYPRLVHIGNLIYQLPNPHNSTQFNSSNAQSWAGNQNHTYYQPGNSTNANWTYLPSSNQNTSSYTQPAQNSNYAASRNYSADQQAASSDNRSWLPYQNTFRPIPDENNDNSSEFSFDPASTPSEPDLPRDVTGHFSLHSSQCTLEVCGNHADTNQYSENVINSQENQTANATNAVSSMDQPDLQEEPMPATVNETPLPEAQVSGDLVKFDTPGTSSEQIRSDSTTTTGQSSNNATSTPVSATNTTAALNDTDSVLESNDPDLNNDPNPTDLNADIQNNNTENPNNNAQPTPQLETSLDSSNDKPNCESFLPRCPPHHVHVPRQLSANFRRLLIRYLNRLDNVQPSTDSSCYNIDDDLINSFVASLNAENRRLLEQDPNNIGMGSETEANGSETVKKEADPEQNEENIGDTQKEADENAATEPKSEKNEENISNSEKNADIKPEPEQNQVTVSNIGQIEADQNVDPEKNPENVSNTKLIETEQNAYTKPQVEQCNVQLASCADQEKISVPEQNSTKLQSYRSGYQSADDVDVINMNLDTIEVTVGDVCNTSIEEDFLEDVPLDLAKEKKIPVAETGAKSRYFEVSQSLTKGNMYWQCFGTPAGQENKTVYAAFDSLRANDTGAHSVDVLLEVPLNLTCKNRTQTVGSQKKDIASNYPELALLLTRPAIQGSGAPVDGKNGIATKQNDYSLMKRAISKLFPKHSTNASEPPKKKACVNAEDPKVLRSKLKNDKPNI